MAGVRFPAGERDSTVSKPAVGPTHPRIQWLPVAISLSVKWPGREAGHLHPSSAEAKNGGRYTSTPPCVYMA
jgi:hypothetical protein